MKITLRKANALQTQINDTIKGIKVNSTVSLTEFVDADTVIVQSNKDLFENDKKRTDLLTAVYAIRGLVGSANATSGLNDKLTTAAYIDKRIGQLQDLAADSAVIGDMATIRGRLDKIRNSKDESRRSLYGYHDNVETGIVTKEQQSQIKTQIQELKKQKVSLNDEILELNVRTEIELDADLVNTLKESNLL